MDALIVIGSHRRSSQSLRVGQIIAERHLRYEFDNVSVHNLPDLAIPFWDEGVWDKAPEWVKITTPVTAAMRQADAFVFVTPEWSGMVTPMLKNYFLLGDHTTMGHKPALIIGVSSGSGGAYPVAELRSSSYKNTKLCYIPEHIIIRNVERVFVAEHDDDDARLSARIRFACRLLRAYADALRSVRRAPLDWNTYPYGM